MVVLSVPEATLETVRKGIAVEWSAAATSVWGKLDPVTAEWLPLTHHLEHAAAMAGLLWDQFLPRSIKELLTSDLAASDAAVRALCC